MSKRYKQAPSESQISKIDTALPTDHPIAVYYRQSTDAQIGNISTTIQTVDMVQYLIARGWTEDKINMIDMDAGVSGTTKIHERPGMSILFELITNSKIRAVACQDEDRLFRDVTQIQVNIFIEACKNSNVLVITPSIVYDFANEFMGAFHARQFRFKSEMAAEYINSVIKGKLQKAKQRLMSDGKWAGAGVPPGYMVDIRKTLSDGAPNPNLRLYTPFESYAEVVRAYFQVFLGNAGHLRETVREIYANGPYFPDPKTFHPPKGFKTNYKIHRYKNGYCPGRTGLAGMLTNAAYIGHWIRNDVVTKWNNHPAIISDEVFAKAFNYLSEVSLDGQPNMHFRPIQEHTRPSRDDSRSEERPLCAGLIFSEYDGKWLKVGTNWVQFAKGYSYVLWSNGPFGEYLWGKKASYIDDAVSTLVCTKLKATFDSKSWQNTLKSSNKRKDQIRKVKISQLSSIQQTLANLITNLETLQNPNMIKAAEARYEAMQAEKARIAEEIKVLDDEENLVEKIKNIRGTYQDAILQWPHMSRNEKRTILHAFINQIQATPGENHGLELTVIWRDGSADRLALPRQATTGASWLISEIETLLKLVDKGASQIQIAQNFPNRKWSSIRTKVYLMRGSNSLLFKLKPIKDRETFYDFLKRTKNKNSRGGLGFDAYSGIKHRDVRGRSHRALGYSLRPPGLHVKWCDAASETDDVE